jgi:hypothetical protein
MSQALDRLSRELRSAVLAGDHMLTERLVLEYAVAVQQVWESLAESDRGASPLPNTVRELLTWARGMTVVQRAIASEQLAVVEKAVRYKSSRAQEPGRRAIQVQA